MNGTKRYLICSDGEVFEGTSFGSLNDAMGELVFTTGMCGYNETLTDPSYAGQIVIQTFPLIGNYGIIPEDFEGKSLLKGYVVRDFCDTPSNFRSVMTLDAYLKEQGIPGICGVDTRALTKRIRTSGVVNAMITSAIPDSLAELKAFRVTGAVEEATCQKIIKLSAKAPERFHVVLMDFGAKRNIAEELRGRGCAVSVVPASADAETIRRMKPDGIMLSNGPGDPADNIGAIKTIAALLGEVPMFGICLGHQLTAIAAGGTTYKMKYGHRGANQPVRDLNTGRTFITTQNHGYAVDPDSLCGKGVIRYVNANDGTCEGIDYPDDGCFTVQFHPEACAGPKDTEFLFDRFIRMMEEQ
ncbi:MAG: carbamoyl phosphate synthase small subunit [Solobacterium sp.]|nr:carbamoyl phosphate synthase small subunit [Solobacterium sp.]